ncbi:potassium/proton antiporter [Idiomarina tyrosinivorans]|uniref:Potassium/proton antiporter n=1 Tax=Idiomarina tyrosinivorans TaxID=1445662 RepID=A0A432ZLS0_9GAMM|nr:potassium/proton antiporter [Idiomarina tyrosinivorans]RUO78172.1 potassium/proton antiporter [Idiomarina tyrosinivorans]
MDFANTLLFATGGLLLISILAGVISNRLGAPILLTFLLIGMLAGEDGLGGIQFDNPELAFLIGSLALLVILFDGGMRTHPERFRVALWPAISLATVGVAITCSLVAATTVWLFGLSWNEGLLLGAILSSTDAAAVFSLFQSRGLRIKERVASTLEIESGTNDPMAVILTVAMTQALSTDAMTNAWWMAAGVVWQLLGGIAMGWICGRLFVIAARKLPLSFSFYPLLALAAAVVTFALTSKMQASGFLAVYLTGYVIGNARLPQLVHILQVQDGLAWLSQISMFLILGLLVTPSHLFQYGFMAFVVALTLLFIARPIAVFISLLPFNFPLREQGFISWVGLRGAVPIILALFPWLSGMKNSDLYFDVAFVVVMTSLIVQGWTISPMAKWLKLQVPPKPEPQQRMPLSAIASHHALEVWQYRIDKQSAACDHTWEQLKLTAPATFVGVLRQGEWLQPEQRPVIQERDFLLVAANVKDLDEVSRILASTGEGPEPLQQNVFFGDFSLHGNLTLADIQTFYPLGDIDEALLAKSIADYFTERFHRRVVIGDQLALGNVMLTVRDMDTHGEILAVGIKLTD